MIANKNAFHQIKFPFLSNVEGKIFKCPGKLRKCSFSEMWPPTGQFLTVAIAVF